jgi:hypothetical protein
VFGATHDSCGTEGIALETRRKELKKTIMTNLVVAHSKAGHTADMMRVANEVLVLDSKNVKALFWLGSGHETNGELVRAKAFFTAARRAGSGRVGDLSLQRYCMCATAFRPQSRAPARALNRALWF